MTDKRQPDPPTGEEEQDAKKLKQGDEEQDADDWMRRLDNLPDYIINQVPDDVLKSQYLTREDLKLSYDDRVTKSWKGHFKELAEQGDLPLVVKPEYGPYDPLPKGHVWDSYIHGSASRDVVVKMNCNICGVGLDHWPEHCPKKKARQGTTGE